MQKRSINLDVIRCIALIYILCVHFFLNTNFYYSGTITGTAMQLGVILRNCFAACVPLFIMLTGYLMNRKTLSWKYYGGLSKVLVLYGLSCIPIWIFRTIENGETFTLYNMFTSYVRFELYAWYIGLYVCLYLMVPFLNGMYHSLETKQKKKVLIGILFILTALPSLTNKFGLALLPTYFESFYPLTYYFMGAYLSEYAKDIKITPVASFALYILVVILGGCFVNIWVTDKWFYDINLFVDWGNLLNTCSSPLLFLSILKCDFSQMPKPLCKMFETVSLVSLQLYIVSYIFDILVYRDFNAKYPLFEDKLVRMILPITEVFIYSLVVALIIQFIYNQIKKGLSQN